MRFDVRDQLSNAQVVTTTAAVSTNSKSKKSITQDLGIGYVPPMGLTIFPKIDGVGATSWTIELIQATDGALTTSIDTLASTSILFAEMKAGKSFFLALPPYKMSKQFFGARITPVGGAGQTVTLDIYFGSADDVATYKAFETPYTVAN